MPKNKVSEWSSTPSNNTDIGGINIAEGCAPSNINNAIRELMAQVKDMQTGSDSDGLVVGGAFTCSGSAAFSSTVALGSSATATTQSPGDNTTKVATTAYVKTAVDSAAGFTDPGANGIVVRTAVNTSTARTISAGTGISISNGNGVSGNPTITNTGVTSVDGSTGSVTINIGTKIAALAYGDVGTYVLGYIFNTSVTEGATYSGSSISPAGHVNLTAVTADGQGDVGITRGSSTLSGTWRAMGRVNVASGSSRTRVTLFLRIS